MDDTGFTTDRFAWFGRRGTWMLNALKKGWCTFALRLGDPAGSQEQSEPSYAAAVALCNSYANVATR